MKEFVDKCNEYGGNIPGAQGVPEEMIREATRYGICKVNIDTDLRLALTAEIRKFLAENPAEFDPRKYLGPGRDAIRAMVQHKIKMCSTPLARCNAQTYAHMLKFLDIKNGCFCSRFRFIPYIAMLVSLSMLMFPLKTSLVSGSSLRSIGLIICFSPLFLNGA